MALLLQSNGSRRRILILLVSLLGFIALGFYGWSRSLHDAGVSASYSEIIMRITAMVTGRQPFIVDKVLPQHWTVLVSFLGIKLVFLYVVFYSVLFLIGRKISVWIWSLGKAKGHSVIIGINEESKSLVTKFSSDGKKVVVIEKNKDHPDIQNLEETGVICVIGDPRVGSVLQSSRISNAKKVIVATKSESDNINIAEAISKHVSEDRDAVNELEVLVAVESDKRRSLLEERWKVLSSPDCVFRLINFQTTAVREIIREVTIDLCGKRCFEQKGPSLLIIADQQLSSELLRQAILFMQISGESVPSFTVLNRDPNAESYFRSRYPDIDLVADICFVNCPADRVGGSEILGGHHFDGLIVSLESELETIGLAYELLDSRSLDVERGYAILKGPQEIELTQPEMLKVMPLINYGKKSPEFGFDEIEKKAEDTHNAYLSGLSEEERLAAETWDELTYATKESNRLAVLHWEVKLKIRDISNDQNEEELISFLACSEHQRWKAEKILAGWKGGPERDNHRKIHDNICSYSEISDEIKERDVTQVKKALGIDDA